MNDINWVVVLDNGYDMPQVIGFFDSEKDGWAALYRIVHEKDFQPNEEWPSLDEWYLRCDAGWVLPFVLGRQVVKLYDIVRFYQDPDRDYEVIRSNVTLEEAQAHCQREDTHGEGWFDGYRAASR